MTLTVRTIASRLWRRLLGVCSGLAAVFALFTLLMLVPIGTGLIITHNADRDLFVKLAKTVGMFVVAFYLLFSASLFFSRQAEDPGASNTAADFGGSSGAPSRWSWLFMNMSHSSKKIRFLLNTILLLGLGSSVTLYAVQIFIDSTPAYADLRKREQAVYTLTYFFESGSAKGVEITGMGTPSYSRFGADYAAIQRDTISAYQDAIKKKPVKVVEIIGYTDAVGSTQNNQKLSRARAETIHALLISAGVPETNISIRAGGERQPGCTQEHAPCFAGIDRRVEVYFR